MSKIALTFALVLALFSGALTSGASEITKATVLRELNASRTKYALAPFVIDPRLELAAGDRMEDMEELGYWAHISPDGRSPFLWLARRGYPLRTAGENLATGFETAEVLVDAWMESRGHRANILSPEYDNVGIAIIDGSSTGRSSGRSIVVLFASEQVPLIIRSPAKGKGTETTRH